MLCAGSAGAAGVSCPDAVAQCFNHGAFGDSTRHKRRLPLRAAALLWWRLCFGSSLFELEFVKHLFLPPCCSHAKSPRLHQRRLQRKWRYSERSAPEAGPLRARAGCWLTGMSSCARIMTNIRAAERCPYIPEEAAAAGYLHGACGVHQ